jgi:hypothetical protein
VCGEDGVDLLVGADFDADVDAAELCGVEADFVTLGAAVEAFDHALVDLNGRRRRVGEGRFCAARVASLPARVLASASTGVEAVGAGAASAFVSGAASMAAAIVCVDLLVEACAFVTSIGAAAVVDLSLDVVALSIGVAAARSAPGADSEAASGAGVTAGTIVAADKVAEDRATAGAAAAPALIATTEASVVASLPSTELSEAVATGWAGSAAAAITTGCDGSAAGATATG